MLVIVVTWLVSQLPMGSLKEVRENLASEQASDAARVSVRS